jgi:ethanolamine utilization protein EutL
VTRRHVLDIWPRLLSCRQIDAVDQQLAVALSLPEGHCSIGLVTCDQDDSLYVALDQATKFADVHVALARSMYAGSKHASGPFSGEVLGVLSGVNPDVVAEGLWALRETLKTVRFQTFDGDALAVQGHPAFLAHVLGETGSSLAPQAGLPVGSPMAYLIAPPVEAVIAVDAALKAAPVSLAKWIAPPSETNFAGAFLAGDLADLHAARDAFVAAIEAFCQSPLQSATRPARLRR